MTTIIPPDLPVDVKTWTTEHVKQFIEANKDRCQLDDDDLRVFNKQKITGMDLLRLEVKDLCDASLGLGPAKRISDLINALKKDKGLVETGLSLSDVLKIYPPALGYMYEVKYTGTTSSTHARSPTSVVLWEGFEDNVDDVIQHLQDDTPKYSRPTLIQYSRISNEEDVRQALSTNVLLPLTTILGQDGEFGRHSILPGGVIGEPDFIQRDSGRKLHLAVEVKTKWVLSVDDLVEAYRQGCEFKAKAGTPPPAILKTIQQIFGYLSHNHLQFGALTTYDRTWFLHRPREDPGQLRISPVIRHDNQQPTLYQSIYYIYSQALEDYECSSAPPSPKISPPPRDDDDDDDEDYDDSKDHGSKRKLGKWREKGKSKKSRAGGEHRMVTRSIAGGEHSGTTRPSHPSNREEAHTPLEFFDWGSFKVLGILGTGRSGTVFKAILHEEIVALKLCDLWQHPDYKEELLNEVEVYHALADLQGYCIPKLKGAGYTAGGLFAIATDIVGRPLEDTERLTDEECQAIQAALSCIHHHGFVHHDIRKENILIKRNGRQFYAFLIDFSFSKQGCQLEFQEEKELLARLLRQ